ncbi:hypothetical protein RclHR1_11910004 [Rhizophagus clarus]|uniref:Uncharacterized protein n=1 Tax=Rhizophagus clarus TaxID=94130 RepID=A0A2Z6QXH4_9GLOM|nr:hypothetical protein RclHR1_11910004 [Rhizophagus clarus]
MAGACVPPDLTAFIRSCCGKIARVMTKGTEEGVENIMKNVNKELDELVTNNDRKPYSLRKRPRVDYNVDRISKRQEQEDGY